MLHRLLLSVVLTLAGVMVSIPTVATGQTFSYAQECVTNVDNATVHLPADAAPSLPDGTPVESGDTLAVYTAQGTCAGHGVWEDGVGATFAAAGADSISVSDNGYPAGESLKFEVFDVSQGQATQIDSGISFASCGNVDVPICAEGDYDDGSFHQVEGFQDNSITRTLTMADGWNYLSIPVQSDLSFDTLLPECSSGFLYTAGEGYTTIGSDESLSAGKGAVVQCNADTTSVTGNAFPSTIDVDAGWNLIGSVGDTVLVDDVSTSPSGILESDFFKIGSDGGFQTAAELRPGAAYWVNVAEAGTLDVSVQSSATIASRSTAASGDLVDANRLLFVDAKGRQTALWLKEGLTQEQRARSQLPPVPPGEMFDVRFAGGFSAASLTSGDQANSSGQTTRVQLQGVAFPIEVQFEANGENRRFDISAGEEEITLSAERSSAQIQRQAGPFTISAAPSPDEFRLGKAYPNPIQDRAEMEYALPEQAEVSIVVYDLLGRRVARLVDEQRPTGLHQAQVDASTLSSGKYFVRMRAAGSFEKTRQLTVVR